MHPARCYAPFGGDFRYRSFCRGFWAENSRRCPNLKAVPVSDAAFSFWSARELGTSFLPLKTLKENTERKHEKLEKMRISPKGGQKYFRSFAAFRVFREIRVRARSLPFFFFFFSVRFCVSSALSVVRSDLVGTYLPEEFFLFDFF